MSALFGPAKEGFLDGTINLSSATIKVALVRNYTFTLFHRYMSQLTSAGGVLVDTATLSGKTVGNGVFDANDVTFETVPSGPDITSLVIFQSSAPGGGADINATAQRLICLIDDAGNLPLAPNGGNVDLVWSGDADKIFTL